VKTSSVAGLLDDWEDSDSDSLDDDSDSLDGADNYLDIEIPAKFLNLAQAVQVILDPAEQAGFAHSPKLGSPLACKSSKKTRSLCDLSDSEPEAGQEQQADRRSCCSARRRPDEPLADLGCVKIWSVAAVFLLFLAFCSLFFVVLRICLGTDFSSEPWKVIVPVCATVVAILLSYLVRKVQMARALKMEIDALRRENDSLDQERVALAMELDRLKSIEHSLDVCEGELHSDVSRGEHLIKHSNTMVVNSALQIFIHVFKRTSKRKETLTDHDSLDLFAKRVEMLFGAVKMFDKEKFRAYVMSKHELKLEELPDLVHKLFDKP